MLLATLRSRSRDGHFAARRSNTKATRQAALPENVADAECQPLRADGTRDRDAPELTMLAEALRSEGQRIDALAVHVCDVAEELQKTNQELQRLRRSLALM